MMYQFREHKNYPDLRVLDETEELILGHIFEDTYLIRKRNGEHVFEDDFYGDPKYGCISPSNDWALVAGEHITLWRTKKGVTIFSCAELQSVHDLRLGNSLVELLVDPWGSRAAVWELNPITAVIRKSKDFLDYQDQEYTEQIQW